MLILTSKRRRKRRFNVGGVLVLNNPPARPANLSSVTRSADGTDSLNAGLHDRSGGDVGDGDFVVDRDGGEQAAAGVLHRAVPAQVEIESKS